MSNNILGWGTELELNTNTARYTFNNGFSSIPLNNYETVLPINGSAIYDLQRRIDKLESIIPEMQKKIESLLKQWDD
jgi:hypothetical protein